MNAIRLPALTLLALLLTACGADSGAPVTSNPPPLSEGAVNYTGPTPRSVDVAAFKTHVWDNLVRVDRCGACHDAGGQSPAFVRRDDINLAFTAASAAVNLFAPADSQLVTKVAGGHNCWLDSNQACADVLTTWITNWAGANDGGEAGAIEFVAPVLRDAGETRYFPASPASFQTHVYPLLSPFCGECHQPASQSPVSPYFAHSNVDAAYGAAQGVINLDLPSASRVVRRLAEDQHNCWSGDCQADATSLANAIAAMAATITPQQPPDELILSKALRLHDGILASSGGRFDNNVIARYEFRTGTGNTAFDTSGIEPALNLTLSGNVEWVGGWGIRINDGKAQGSVAASRKLSDLIRASGEFTLEAWAVPATPAQQNANIISYSGGPMVRNVTLGQDQSRYSGAVRHDNTGPNGMPSMISPDESLQATLQHVALTYDPINGRRLFINGVDSGSLDQQSPTLLGSWDDTYALVLGNEANNSRLWQGVLRFVAIHNRALTGEQLAQNFAAGVGERFYLLFSIAEQIDQDNSFIGFEVARFDNFSYLFAEPFFIVLGDNPSPAPVMMEGMRIGINGREPGVGQTWTRLSATLGGDEWQAPLQPLSRLGTLIELENGEQQDEFFLTFARLAGRENVYTDSSPLPVVITPEPPQPRIGLRTFDRVHASMSAVTGISMAHPDVRTTFNLVRQQLPVNDALEGFVTAHQIGIAQLAIEYCNALVDEEAARNPKQFFVGMDFTRNANSISVEDWRSQVIDPLVQRMVGTNLSTQPAVSAVSAELESLLLSSTDIKPINNPDGIPDGLARCGGTCPTEQTLIATKAACAAALGSATLLLH
ncbi:MAG: LamG domain-containing protein [Alcanivoracaceae bacterium]